MADRPEPAANPPAAAPAQPGAELWVPPSSRLRGLDDNNADEDVGLAGRLRTFAGRVRDWSLKKRLLAVVAVVTAVVTTISGVVKLASDIIELWPDDPPPP